MRDYYLTLLLRGIDKGSRILALLLMKKDGMAVNSPLLLKGRGKGVLSPLTVEVEGWGKSCTRLTADGEGRDGCSLTIAVEGER